jgi:hypothetical protein
MMLEGFPSCCGIIILHQLDHCTKDEVQRQLVHVDHGILALVAVSQYQRASLERLRGMGFKTYRRFRNRGRGNNINLMGLVWKGKLSSPRKKAKAKR